MLIRTILLFFLGLFVSACSTPYTAVMKKYQDAPICCNSMSQFKFEAIKVGDSKSSKLTEESAAFSFDTGKSYFKAFEIPQTGYPYHFLIKSYMLGDHIKSAYIFVPYVLTLDEKYQIVQSTLPSNMLLRKSGFTETMKETGGLGRKLEGYIQFTMNNKNERYIVLLTTKSLLKEKLFQTYRTFVPIVLPGLVTLLPGSEDSAFIPSSPIGHLNVSLVPGFAKDFIIIDHTEEAFTVFAIIPEDSIDKVKENIKDKKDVDVVFLEEFTQSSEKYIKARIVKDEYPDSRAQAGLMELVRKFPGTPIGLTWNGGIAITYDDYQHAKRIYGEYRADPASYERSRNRDSRADPINPKGHFGPLLGW